MVLVFILMLVTTLVLLYFLFPVFEVCGDSMYPTYLDGEILFGTKLYRKSHLKKGDVILYKTPTNTKRVVIKRIDHTVIKEGVMYVYCLGDNSEVSHDSRSYGLVSSDRIVCKVIDQR